MTYHHTTPPSHTLHAIMLETLPGALFFIDSAGTIVYANENARAITGTTPEKLQGHTFWDCVPQLMSTSLNQAICTARETQAPTEVEYLPPLAQTRLHVHITPVREGLTLHFHEERTPDHSIDSLVHAEIDHTTHTQDEEQTRPLIDTIPQFVWMMLPDGFAEYHNRRWCDYTAMTPEQAQGNGWMQAIHPDDRLHIQNAWQRSIQTGTPYETEQRLRNGTTGTYRWFLARAMPLKDAHGKIMKWLGTNTDIDDRKQAEQRLKASEENLRVLAETVPQLIWEARPDGSVTYVNQRYMDYTHASFAQLWDYGWCEFLHPDDRQRTLAHRKHALETGEPYNIEYRLSNGPTGTYRWFLARANPVRDDTGQIVKWIGTTTDIDDRKQAEQRLKASEENLRVLAETVPQLVWEARPDGSVTYVNQHYLDHTYTSFAQLLDYGWCEFLHPDDRQRALAHRKHALETGEPYNIEYRLRNGQTGAYTWFLVRANPVRDDTGQIVKWFGTSTDIDEQKRIEDALRQSQERVNVLMKSSNIGIFTADGEQIIDANDTFLRMTGYTREDLRAGNLNWIHMTPPEYLARTRQAHQELDPPQPKMPYEKEYVCKDGSRLPVVVGQVVLQNPHRETAFVLDNSAHKKLDPQQTRMPYEKEYICKDGSRLPVVVGQVAIQKNPHRETAFVLDNSAHKELDQRKDDFITVACHELRGPLTALKLQASLLKKRLCRQSIQDSSANLAQIEAQINNGVRLMETLLDVSRIQTGELKYAHEPVDLDSLLGEIVKTMQQTCSTHTIILRGTTQTTFMGDRDRLEQVFINLLSNAIKYSPYAQTVEIDLSASKETVTISVQDHGFGIPQEQHEKIFERFYRATNARQLAIPGMGIGLYMVAEIVSHYGGTITMDSQVKQGSTFHVTLPLKRAN